MRFGWCVRPENISIIEESGYDYYELPVGSVYPEGSEEEFNRTKAEVEKHKLRVESFNLFMPPEVKIVGPEVDFSRLEKYVKTAFRRIANLGGRVVGFGAGGSRAVPENFPREQASKQLEEFLRMVASWATIYDLTFATEPLNRKETNFINKLEEAVEFSRRINHERIRVLVDLYHFREEGESFSELFKVKDLLVHVHVADGSERLYPGSRNYDFVSFFKHLKSIGYDRRISVECRTMDLSKEAPLALKFLKETWAKS